MGYDMRYLSGWDDCAGRIVAKKDFKVHTFGDVITELLDQRDALLDALTRLHSATSNCNGLGLPRAQAYGAILKVEAA